MNTSSSFDGVEAGDENAARVKARQVLLDAASLCAWCLGYWRDEQERMSSGEEISYAIDVDVVQMYSAPQRTLANGRVFSHADDVSDLISGLVGDYVLHRLQSQEADERGPKGSLVLIPPHGAELRGVAEAMASRQAQAAAADTKRLKDVTNSVRTRLVGSSGGKAVDSFLEFLSEHASEVHNLLLGKTGAAAEIARLNMLPAGRLARPAGHPAFAGTDGLSVPPSRLDSGAETSAVLTQCTVWYELMLDQAGPLRPFKLSKLDDDAWVLASLEWINADAVRRGIRKRLVLITATERLHIAGRKMEASHSGYGNFAEAYLRDPRAFLGARDFFSIRRRAGSGDTEFRILEWMSVLFPTSIQQGRAEHVWPDGNSSAVTVNVSLPEVRAIASGDKVNSALDILLSSGYRQTQEDSFPEGALDEWRDVVRDTHSQVVLSRQENAESKVLADLLREIPDSPEGRVDHLMDRLAKRVQQSFTGLYLATGVIGVEQLLEIGTKMRGLPALRFDLPEYQDAQAQCDALADELFRIDRQRDSFDLAKMYEALSKSDASHYHAHVLHAFVYASTGRWFSARTLCRIALLVADSLPPATAGRRTGREASYLMAVAERRLAVNAQGMQFASKALSEAKRRAVAREADDPRFASEALAQEITQAQIDYFNGRLKLLPDAVPLLTEAKRLCALALSDDLPRILKRWVVRQASTNGLIAAALSVDAGQRKPQVVGLARELINMMEKELLAPSYFSAIATPQKYADEISDFIWLVAVTLFDSQQRASDARSALTNWVPCHQPQAMLTYEAERYRRFMRLAGCEPLEAHDGRVPG